MKTYSVALSVLLLANCIGAAGQDDPYGELSEHLRGTKWQWDGAGGEVIVFADDGYVQHGDWTRRGLVTRWDAIDRRTVLLRIERGRASDRYAVLAFNEDVTAYSGFNFHGATKLKTSTRLPVQDKAPNVQLEGISR